MDAQFIVDRIYGDAKALKALLVERNEVSLSTSADEVYRKNLLMACASYHEHKMCDIVRDFATSFSSREMLCNLIEKKAIARQYHTWFKWDGNNANTFFGLFGEEYKNRASSEIASSEELKSAVKSFLFLGYRRNKLVHDNFAAQSLELTEDEIIDNFKKSLKFLEYVGASLHEQC